MGPRTHSLRGGLLGLGAGEGYAAPAPPARNADGAPAGSTRLRVLPNCDVVALGTLEAAERLLLEAYAEPRTSGTWTLRRDGLLRAAAEGHPVADLRDHLAARAEGGIPGPVAALLDEAEQRSAALRNTGVWRVLEVSDPNLALLVTHDRRLRSLCAAAGEHHVLVRPDKEAAFMRALHQLGYGVRSDAGPAGGA